MKKRIFAAVLSLMMLVGLVAPAAYATDPTGPELTVTASATTANPGDEITYTVTMGAVTDLLSMGMRLDIPEGLTYVAGSGALADNLRTTLGFDALDWTENSKMISGYGAYAYTSGEDTVLATFKCTVNEGYTGSATVGLTELEFYCGSWSSLVDVSDSVAVTPAVVEVAAKPVPVTGVTVSPVTLTLEQGETAVLTATVEPGDATNQSVTFTSSNPAVVSVDDKGTVTALAEGTATITVITVDGGKTATCVITVPHKHTFGEEWKYDADKHWHECIANDGAKADEAAHTGGTATCIAQAVCDVCGHSYGELAEHSYVQNPDAKYLKSAATCISPAVYSVSCSVCGAEGTETFVDGAVDSDNHVGDTYIVGQKEATCEGEGYTGDTYCGSCDGLIAEGTVIPAAGHTPADVWSTDEEYHWKECVVGCGNILNKALHSGGEANCHASAICEVCGVRYGAVDPDHHDGETEVRGYVAATEETEGYTGDTYCLGCGEKIAEGEVIPKLSHEMTHHAAVAATCVSTGSVEYYSCSNCGRNFSDAEGTVELETVVTPIDPKNHTGETEVKGAVEPTCTEVGYTGDTYCADCGEKLANGTEIPAAGHKLTKVEAVDATHAAAGNIEYYVCTVDGALFRDAEGTEAITLEDTIIPQIPHTFGEEWESDAENHWHECECGARDGEEVHTYGDWTVTKEATETEAGSKERSCAVCGHTEAEEIPAISVTDPDEPGNNPGDTQPSDEQGKQPINTGDSSIIEVCLIVMALAAAGLIVVFVMSRRRRNLE